MELDHTHPFTDSSEKAGNWTTSQQLIDEALERICNDPDVIDLTQQPLEIAVTNKNKAKHRILANSTENCRDDLEYELLKNEFSPGAIRLSASSSIGSLSRNSNPIIKYTRPSVVTIVSVKSAIGVQS